MKEKIFFRDSKSSFLYKIIKLKININHHKLKIPLNPKTTILMQSAWESGTIIKNPKKNKFSEKFKNLLRKIISKIRVIKIKFIAQNKEN